METPLLPDDDPDSMPSERTMRGAGHPGEPVLGRIDQYELVRKLGGGGFGVVYLARDTAGGIEVAIKTLHPLLKHNAEEMERLREKFKLVSRLAHPNIATALVLHPVREIDIYDEDARRDLKLSPGDSVMVMRYAPGVTLSKWRRQFPGGVVPFDRALEIGRQVASALDCAHERSIVHRDVKPENLMVSTDPATGRADVQVLDFGLAAEIRSSVGRMSQEKGDTSGTRPYMAPEQWQGRKQDGRTDQYALACVLYELLSGAPPFSAVFETGDPAIMLQTVRTLDPDPVGGLPGLANAALAKALSKEPAERFGSCSAFMAALGGDAVAARAPRPSGGEALPSAIRRVAGLIRENRKTVAVASAGVAIFLCGFLASSVFRPGKAERSPDFFDSGKETSSGGSFAIDGSALSEAWTKDAQKHSDNQSAIHAVFAQVARCLAVEPVAAENGKMLRVSPATGKAEIVVKARVEESRYQAFVSGLLKTVSPLATSDKQARSTMSKTVDDKNMSVNTKDFWKNGGCVIPTPFSSKDLDDLGGNQLRDISGRTLCIVENVRSGKTRMLLFNREIADVIRSEMDIDGLAFRIRLVDADREDVVSPVTQVLNLNRFGEPLTQKGDSTAAVFCFPVNWNEYHSLGLVLPRFGGEFRVEPDNGEYCIKPSQPWFDPVLSEREYTVALGTLDAESMKSVARVEIDIGRLVKGEFLVADEKESR